MSRRQTNTLVLTLAVSLALIVRHFTRSTAKVYMVSDILFFVSMVLLVMGAIGAVSNSGLFDIVGYSSRRVLDLVANKPEETDGTQDFAHYVHRPRKKYDVRLLLIGGFVCLLVSLAAAAGSVIQ